MISNEYKSLRQTFSIKIMTVFPPLLAAFKNVRLLWYVLKNLLMTVCKRRRFQIKHDMQVLLLLIKVSVLCLATNGTLGDFSYHFYYVLSLSYIFSTFCNNFWNNHKKITAFEKDLWWLVMITFRSFNALHVMHANTYLHTLCTKNINTFYTSKDSYILFFWKFMNNSVMLAC